MKNRIKLCLDILLNKSLWINLLLGATLTFSYAPFSLWWLTWIILPIWLLYASKRIANASNQTRSAFAHGFSFGLGWFAAGISWVHVSIAQFGGLPLIVSLALMLLLCMYLALYPALAIYLTVRASTWRSTKINWWLLAPAWIFTEYLRGVVLTGFPWLSLGYSQLHSPLAVFAPIVGETGITFVLIAMAVAIYKLSQRQYKLAFSALVTVCLLTVISSHQQWTTATGETKRIALVQGNIEQSIKWKPEQQWPTMLNYLDLSRVNYDADVIVWPESAIPAIETMSTTQEFLDIANQSASLNKAAIITGIINYNFESREYFNALIVLGKKHVEDDEGSYYYNNKNRYYKNHLLPIGEFVPFGDLLRPLAPLFNLPMSSFTRGDYVQNNLMANGIRFLPLICFEIAFPNQLSANFANASDMLLTVSNDAWFGNSHGPHQHMEIAQMRALEFGRPLVRATNTGVTAITDHKGKIMSVLPQFEQGVIKTDLALVTGLTPYARFGNALVYFVSFLLFIATVSTQLLRTKKATLSNG